MDYNRMMIITLDEKSVLFSTDAQKLGVHVEKYFSKRPFIVKLLNQLDKRIDTTFARFFYGEWKKNLSEIDFILLNSHYFSRPLIKYLNRKYPHIRIAIWYSNPVEKDTPISYYADLNCELWSFDIGDCEKYQMHFNNQFIDETKVVASQEDPKYQSDVCFIGVDKQRLSYLLELEAYFVECNLNPFIYVVDSSKNSYSNYDYKKPIPYSELIKYEANTSAILDVVQENQHGISLRPLEALFLNKKLITNNHTVLNMDFYEKENIFLLSKQNMSEILTFLKVPMKPVAETVKEKYSFKGWLNNFFI